MQKIHLRRVVLIASVIAVLLVGSGYVIFAWAVGALSWPPTDWLGRWYLDAVVKQDMSAIERIGGSCWSDLELAAHGDMKLYSGSEIRQVQTNITPNKGSSDTIEFLSVDFEYRPAGQSGQWRKGSIDFTSNYGTDGSIFRHLCPAGG